MAITIPGTVIIGARPGGSSTVNKSPIDLTSQVLDSRILFIRTSTKLFFSSNGEFSTAANDVWPVECDPVTRKPLGRWCEPQRTNYYLNNTSPGQLSRALSGTGSTLTNEAAVTLYGASFLKTTAITTVADPGVHALRGGTSATTPNSSTIASCFAVATDATTTGITFYADTASNFTQFPLDQKLQRLNLSLPAATSHFWWAGNRNAARTANIAIGLYQLEIGDYATSPILTSGSPVTRAADIALIQTFGSKKIIATYSDGSKEEIPMTGDSFQLPWSSKIYSRIEYA